MLQGREGWLRARHKRTNKYKKGEQEGFDEASRKAAQQPATVGIVLGDKPAAHGECRVVAAGGGGVVNDNGSRGATARGADHPPAVASHPLRGGCESSTSAMRRDATHRYEVHHPRHDGVARAAGGHRAAGKFGTQARSTSAVGPGVGDSGGWVVGEG